MSTKTALLIGCMCIVGLDAQAQTVDLAALQSAVREMCVQPDRKGSYLQLEGDLSASAGAILKIVGVNGQGKITKEEWDGISQRLDQYKTDPRACAVSLVGVLAPILSRSPAAVNQSTTGTCSPAVSGVGGSVNLNCK
jgi:hypothetical protein